MEASTGKVDVKGLRDIDEYCKRDSPTKSNVMFWNTLSLSINSDSVTLKKKMDHKRKF